MPRRPKFTKEEVLKSAFDVARKNGIEAVTASSVAANMGYAGSSLFTHFESMDEIRHEVYFMVKKMAVDYFRESLDYFPAFKELGLRWIRMVKEDPNLYRILFAGNPVTHNEDVLSEFEEVFNPICEEVKKTFGISNNDAKKLMFACIVQTNGVVLSILNGSGENYSEERIGEELGNVCMGMLLLIKAKDGSLTEKDAKELAMKTDIMPVYKK